MVITTLEELRHYAGRELGHGPWVNMTQELVNRFADLSGDSFWIHVDEERAKESPFGGTIAHGMLTLSMIPFMRRGFDGVTINVPRRMALNYGLDKVRFPAPVRVGARIRLRTTLARVEDPRPNEVSVVRLETVDIEGGSKPAVVAEQITRWFF